MVLVFWVVTKCGLAYNSGLKMEVVWLSDMLVIIIVIFGMTTLYEP